MPLCVGIGGGSGCGKSWLAGFLKGKLGRRAVVVCQDWYYRDNSHVSDEEALAKAVRDHIWDSWFRFLPNETKG